MPTLITSHRLCRSESDRFIAGVCGGIANYFDIDVTLVRLVFILVILLGGSGILVYVILWLILPTESNLKQNVDTRISDTAGEIKQAAHSLVDRTKKMHHERRPLWGIFLIGLGLVLLLQNFGLAHYLELDKTWPILIIILGFLVLSRG